MIIIPSPRAAGLVLLWAIQATLFAGTFKVSTHKAIETNEAGGALSISVALNAVRPPRANVYVYPRSSDPSEGRVLERALVFKPDTWREPLNFSLIGVNDSDHDGLRTYTVELGLSVSEDPNWHGIPVGSIQAHNVDDDLIVLTGARHLTTCETNCRQTFQVKLGHKPWADVILSLRSSRPDEGIVTPKTLTFTPADWDVNQTVHIHGVDDDRQDGSVVYTVQLLPIQSYDQAFEDVDPDDITVISLDDERNAQELYAIEHDHYQFFESDEATIQILRLGDISQAGETTLINTSHLLRYKSDHHPVLPANWRKMVTFKPGQKSASVKLPLNPSNLIDAVNTQLDLSTEHASPTGGTTIITVLDDSFHYPEHNRRRFFAKVGRQMRAPLKFAVHREALIKAGKLRNAVPVSAHPSSELPSGLKLTYKEREGVEYLTWRPNKDQIGEHVIKLRTVYLDDPPETIYLQVYVTP